MSTRRVYEEDPPSGGAPSAPDAPSGGEAEEQQPQPPPPPQEEECSNSNSNSNAAAAVAAQPQPPQKKKRKYKKHNQLPGYRERKKDPTLAAAYAELETANAEAATIDEEIAVAKAAYLAAKARYDQVAAKRASVEAKIASATEAAKMAELNRPLRWNEMYKKLQAYREQHGDTFLQSKSSKDAPNPEHDALYTWVALQRKSKERLQTGRPDRFEALERLDFVWNVKAEQTRRKMVEVRAYIEEHGSLTIPFKYPPNQQLSTWVAEQRKEYRKFQRGLPSVMTAERIASLTEAGFEWTCSTSRKRRRVADDMTEEEMWYEGYELLAAFRDRHGHCRVTLVDRDPDSTKLREWTAWQRRQYREMEEGKPSQLTPERIGLLEGLGFVWESSYASYCAKNNVNFMKRGAPKTAIRKEEEEGDGSDGDGDGDGDDGDGSDGDEDEQPSATI